MAGPYPFELMEDPVELMKLGEWNEEIYKDFNKIRDGKLTEEEFRTKYVANQAILCLDMTGFTEAAIKYGELFSLMRIYDVQKVCGPIFKKFNANLTRAFADDLTGIFDSAGNALDASLEIHKRIRIFNESDLASAHPAECCIGIGYGNVFAIGPNLAMGDEMNRASKLGEDTARAYEILITENTYAEVKNRQDCIFSEQNKDDLPFPFYSVVPVAD